MASLEGGLAYSKWDEFEHIRVLIVQPHKQGRPLRGNTTSVLQVEGELGPYDLCGSGDAKVAASAAIEVSSEEEQRASDVESKGSTSKGPLSVSGAELPSEDDKDTGQQHVLPDEGRKEN